MEEGREELQKHSEELLVGQVDGYFDEFLAIFRPIRDLSKEHKERFQPQLKQLEEMEKGFTEVERDVGLEAGGLDADSFAPMGVGGAPATMGDVPAPDFSGTSNPTDSN